MIELLCVMVIIGSLGTSAIGTMMDFRNEARAAAVRTALNTIRVGIRNQRQQALLKCGFQRICTEEDMRLRIVGALSFNDLTSPYELVQVLALGGRTQRPPLWCGPPVAGTPVAGTPVAGTPLPITPPICTAEQLPNQAERGFFAPGASRARVQSGFSPLPDNPFISAESTVHAVALRYRSLETRTKCDLVDMANTRTNDVNGNTVPQVTHWIYLLDIDEIIAGTNTPGIRECDF